MTDFEAEVEKRLRKAASNFGLRESAAAFLQNSMAAQYSYNWFWLGRPIIQYPQDIMGVQELIWRVQPDVVVETGIAHGGSLILSASLLALLDLCEAAEAGASLDPSQPRRRVIGVDIDIRRHNRAAIEAHPLASRIKMIEGSSVDLSIVDEVRSHFSEAERVLVFLDSNHTQDHVLAELEAYARFVSPGSYCVVFDTIVDDLPADMFGDRPWGPGDNPKTAVDAWLKDHPEFEIDRSMDHKLMISVAPGGYLRRRA